jgi:hypothetical protein
MNANEISPKAGVRLNRIKILSRIAQVIVFCFFVFTIWFLLRGIFSLFRQHDFGLFWRQILGNIYTIVLCVWYWELAQLFRCFARGLVFAAKTIRCLKVLGVLCAIGWAVKLSIHIAFQHYSFPAFHPSPGVMVVKQQVYQMGFFSFDFGTGIDFGLLLAGAIVVLIAWIMDEGRKIQEEQELTV